MSKPSTRLSLLTRRGERRSSRLNEPNSSKICVQRQSAKRWRQKSHRAIRTPWLTACRRSRWRRRTIPKPPTWSKAPWSQINTRSRFCILIDKTETQENRTQCQTNQGTRRPNGTAHPRDTGQGRAAAWGARCRTRSHWQSARARRTN